MASKQREKNNGDWKGFMDVPLTAALKEQCLAWDCDGDDFETQVDAFVRGGYKLSLSWNEKTQSFVVAATGSKDAGKNAGYTMSAHAKTAANAVFVLSFKHRVVCEEDWSVGGHFQKDEDFG